MIRFDRRCPYAVNKYALQPSGFVADYWQQTYDAFDAAYTKSIEVTGRVSIKASDKNTLKKELQAVVNSLILLIKAYHPKDYKAILRARGIQKKKY